MKICFWHSDKPRERILSEAFAQGIKACGDEMIRRPLTPEIEIDDTCDVAIMCGVKSAERWRANQRSGIHVLMLDKGYCRGKSKSPVKGYEYWRFSVDAHHPTDYLMDVKRPFDRLEALDLELKPWRSFGKYILIVGSSLKYHNFYGMEHPTEWAEKIVRKLKKITHRPIVYRPKPSWKDASPIRGSRFSSGGRTIGDELAKAHCVVTHGSNATFEALLAGVPSIVLGEAITKSISSRSLDQVENPILADSQSRWQLLANLAYCQWTMEEIASGLAWKTTRPLIFR